MSMVCQTFYDALNVLKLLDFPIHRFAIRLATQIDVNHFSLDEIEMPRYLYKWSLMALCCICKHRECCDFNKNNKYKSQRVYFQSTCLCSVVSLLILPFPFGFCERIPMSIASFQSLKDESMRMTKSFGCCLFFDASFCWSFVFEHLLCPLCCYLSQTIWNSMCGTICSMSHKICIDLCAVWHPKWKAIFLSCNKTIHSEIRVEKTRCRNLKRSTS